MIRPLREQDWAAVWQVMAPTVRAGETFAFPRDMTSAEGWRAWVETAAAAFVAEDEGAVVGSYYVRTNQPGAGSHVCNAGYVVGEAARGKGVAGRMCEHSQEEARRLGYRAMQFNLVVSTNEGAVRLWQRHGFAIVGTLPGAFRHPARGDVDAFVMYKAL
jgi:L-amino acid N-acyltransferase YncA